MASASEENGLQSVDDIQIVGEQFNSSEANQKTAGEDYRLVLQTTLNSIFQHEECHRLSRLEMSVAKWNYGDRVLRYLTFILGAVELQLNVECTIDDIDYEWTSSSSSRFGMFGGNSEQMMSQCVLNTGTQINEKINSILQGTEYKYEQSQSTDKLVRYGIPAVWAFILLVFLIPGMIRQFGEYEKPPPSQLLLIMIVSTVVCGAGGLFSIITLTPLLFASHEYLTNTPRGQYWMKISGLKNAENTGAFRIVVTIVLLASVVAFGTGSFLPFAFFFGH